MALTTPGRNAAAMPDVRPLVEAALVRDFGPGEGLAAGAADPAHDAAGWTGVPVPGDVHRALVAAGRIPDPFRDRDEHAVRWMEEREWWYRMRFTGPEAADEGERLRLVLHGLDTYATLFLDGVEVGRHANMFREAVLDVTHALEHGREHVLAVRFDPPLQHVGPDLPDQWAPFNRERVWMRKGQSGFGWDWGPRLPTIGVWRPVELRRVRQAALAGLRFTTLRLPGAGADALVEVRVEAERAAAGVALEADVELRPPDGGEPVRATLHLPDGERAAATADLRLRDPALWWTHDLGEPALHGLRVTLRAGGEAVDVREEQVGVRTIALDQDPDPEEPGTRFFRFVLNGVPVFARGANWIPADAFVGDVPAERYERLVVDARDANMNMLRVWGGGIYEHDLFYDLCDRLGLLVWQDFMLACAIYPEREIAEEVELEARYQVARLRDRPCLALWCGNNENQWIHDQTFPERGGERVGGSLFYDEVLPRVVAELDGRTPYWPGSPYGGDDHNDRAQGDVHNWEVWHGNSPRRFGEPGRKGEPTPESVSFRRYAEDAGRFISEFGVLSAPDRETLRRVIPADQLWHHSPAMDHHTKDTPKDKVDMLLQSVTGVADDLDEFVDFSQIAQAEAMKFGLEHFRRRTPHCSGTLIWQLNDVWPGLSWALLDFHGFGKAAYWFVRRAYAPVLASMREAPDGALELWVTNDGRTEVRDTARLRLGAFAGGAPRHEEAVPYAVAARESRCVRRFAPGELEGGPDRYVVVRSAGGAFHANRHFFAAIKDLVRRVPAVEHEVHERGEGEVAVRLRSDGYAYLVHLEVADEAVRRSDDYVELEPGEERWLTLSGGARAEDVTVRWR